MSLFLPSSGKIRLGGFRLLVIYIIVYFGVVFDFFSSKMKELPYIYVFSKSNNSLIKFMSVLFSI